MKTALNVKEGVIGGGLGVQGWGEDRVKGEREVKQREHSVVVERR